MRIKQVTFGKNIQTKPYHFERAEVTIELGPKEHPNDAINLAKRECDRILGIDVCWSEVEDAEETLAKAKKAGLR